jgi:general secretion pathway protein I
VLGRQLYRSKNGFTLIEVLVALLIASLSLAVILQILRAGLQTKQVSQEYQIATLFAETKLASIGGEGKLQPGVLSGTFNGQYRWRVRVTPYREKDTGDPSKGWTKEPLVVAVTVTWGNPAERKSVALKTLRLMK